MILNFFCFLKEVLIATTKCIILKIQETMKTLLGLLFLGLTSLTFSQNEIAYAVNSGSEFEASKTDHINSSFIMASIFKFYFIYYHVIGITFSIRNGTRYIIY